MIDLRVWWVKRFWVGSYRRGKIVECHWEGKSDSWEDRCCWTIFLVYVARSDVIVCPWWTRAYWSVGIGG